MAEKQYIKHLYEEEGKSLREIARKTGLSFQTVKKYAHQDNWNEKAMPKIEKENYPVLGAYIETIDKWLEDDKKEPRKQQHTISRVYRRLQKEKGFSGSYGSVKKYIKKKKLKEKRLSEGYLPLEQAPCHAEIDFGKFKYYDSFGFDRQGYALTISFPYSNMAYTQVFEAENSECLLTGMKRIFNYICGVPIRVRADNMTTAVAHVLKGTERELTDSFSRFMLHYRFAADFCNPSSGNEKGNVENKVGYTRRNFFVPVPNIKDFDKFNEELWAICEEDGNRLHYRHNRTHRELWEEERKQLKSLPVYEFEVFRYKTARISKTGFVSLDTNHYGISPEFSGQMAQLKIFYNKIEIYVDHSHLKSYKRKYGKNEEIGDFKEYLNILTRKPNALTHTKFFDQIPKLWQEYLKTTQGKERKTAIMLLMEIVQEGNENLCDEVLSMSFECGRSDVDSVRQCYYMITKAEYHPKPLELSKQTPIIAYNPSLLDYDRLVDFGGAASV